MKIGFDVDGVLADLLPVWIETYNKKFDDNLKIETVTDYDLSKFTKKCTKEELLELLQDSKFYDNVKVYDGAIELTKKVIDAGHEIFIITHGEFSGSNGIGSKFKWLEKHFSHIPMSNWIVCSKKQMIIVDCLVEDHFENLLNANYKGYLINKPYNESFSGNTNISRINNLLELKDIFIKKNNRRKCKCGNGYLRLQTSSATHRVFACTACQGSFNILHDQK